MKYQYTFVLTITSTVHERQILVSPTAPRQFYGKGGSGGYAGTSWKPLGNGTTPPHPPGRLILVGPSTRLLARLPIILLLSPIYHNVYRYLGSYVELGNLWSSNFFQQ